MPTWGPADALREAKADSWLDAAKKSTDSWLESLGFTGQQEPAPEPLGFSAALPTAEEYHARSPWRDLDPPKPAASLGLPSATASAVDMPGSEASVGIMPSASGATATRTPPSMPTITSGQRVTGAPMGPGESVGSVTTTSGPSDLEGWARSEARRLHIDPEVAVRVGNTEGRFEDPTRQNMEGAPAYGPYQLYIGGSENPGLGDEALAAGIEPRNPAHARQAITFALENAAKHGWGAFQGAAAHGIGPWDGIGVDTPQASLPASRSPVSGDPYPRQDLLSDPDKWAVCGPLGVMAFGAMTGHPVSYEQAKAAATAAGWTSGSGMAGPASQVAALRGIGVAAKTGPIDMETIAHEVRNGNPVGLSSPGAEGHYFTVQGVDDQGRLDLGNSALSLRASGGTKRFWTLDELRAIGPLGNVDTAIYLDNPASPTPSVAAAPTAGVTPAPATPPVSPEPAVSPPAPQAAGDLVTIQNVDSGQSRQVPREQLPDWLKPVTPNMPPSWRVVDGPQAMASPLDAARAGTDGFQASALSMKDMPDEGGPPVRDDYRNEPSPPPFDPDQGPRETGYTLPAEPPSQATAEEEGQYQSQQRLQIEISQGGPPTPSAQFTEMPVRQPQAATPEPQVVEQSMSGGLIPVWNATHTAIEEYIKPAAEGIKRAATGLLDAAKEPQNAVDTLTSAGQRAGSAALEGAAEHATSMTSLPPPPTSLGNVMEAADWLRRRIDPLAPYNDIVAAAVQAFGDEVGRRVSAAMGVPETEIANVLGHSITGQDVGGFIGSSVLDPSNYFGAEPAARTARTVAEAAGPALREGAETAGRRIRSALDVIAEREAAADARRAEGGGTQLPGVFGVSGLEPNRPEVQGMRPRVIPPHVADELDFPLRVPDDPNVIRAIEAAGGTVDERGVTLNVIRNQGPEAAGGTATRGGTFYIAGPPGTPNPYASATSGQTGGPVRIEAPTRFRSPLILSDAPGDARGFEEGMRSLAQDKIQQARQQADEAMQAYQAAVEKHGGDAVQLRARRDAIPVSDDTFEVYDRSGNLVFTGESRSEAIDWYSRHRGGDVSPQDIVRAPAPRNQAWLDADAALQEVFRAAYRVREARRASDLAQKIPTGSEIDTAIQEATRGTKPGSPARAQALKDLVSRYGGDPNVIDDLLAVRGADHSESAWAIKENIVSANARAQKYDGVVTVVPGQAPYAQVQLHPAVQAAGAELDKAVAEVADAKTALLTAQRAKQTGDWSAFSDQLAGRRRPQIDMPALEQRVAAAEKQQLQAEAAMRAAENQANRELASPRISELMDPREARNPTPGERNPKIAEAQATIDASWKRDEELQQQIDALMRQQAPGAEPSPEFQRLSAEKLAEMHVRDRLYSEWGRTIRDEPTLPPGYTLRPDIPRRSPVRESTIEANPRVAAIAREFDEATAAEEAASTRFEAATRAHNEHPTRENWQEYQAAGEALAEASRRADAASAAHHALAYGPPEPPYTTMQASAGTLPLRDSLGALGRTANTEALNAAGGAFAGNVVSGDVIPDENDTRTPQERIRDAALHAGTGAGAAVAARHGGRALASRLGREAEGGGGALATMGNVPPSFNTPLVQRAVSTAQQRQAAMQRRGLTTPSVWDWIKQAGYAGIYGPATAINSVVGGAQELVLGQPKEAIRALVSGRPGSYGAQVAGQIRAMPEGLAGLGRVLLGSDSASSAAASGGSQGTANLSERVVNPIGHFAARLLERPGEILTEAPDAVFRPMFIAAGMQREARTVAAEMGKRGQQAAAYADLLMQSAEQVRANPGIKSTSAEARRVAEAGTTYADDLGYKGKPGEIGQWLGRLAKRDDPIGVMASFLVPFPSMAARMSTAAARSTPLIGLLPSVRRGQATKFDVVYDQAFGTAVAAGLAYWAFNGGITGSGPADPEKRKMMVDQGWQPSSYVVAGHYIPNRTAGRFQLMLDTAGELHDALTYGTKDQKPSDLAADLVKRGSRVATDQIGLSGLADLHDMLTQGFESQFPGWAARSAGRYVPGAGVFRAIAAGLDTASRSPEKWKDVGFGESVRQNAELMIPGARQNVPSTQSLLGDESPNPQRGFGAILPRVTTQKDDPIIGAFQQAGVDIGMPPDKISDVPITPAQQRKYQQIMGRELRRIASPVVSGQNWQTMPPQVKKQLLETFQSTARTLAETAIVSEGGTKFAQDRAKATVDKALGR